MSDRLPTAIGVGALLRRINDAGGMAMVRAKGDAQSGAVLFLIDDGPVQRALERGTGPTGASALVETQRVESSGDSLEDYWRRRRVRDPDLWILELRIPEAERFIVETMSFD